MNCCISQQGCWIFVFRLLKLKIKARQDMFGFIICLFNLKPVRFFFSVWSHYGPFNMVQVSFEAFNTSLGDALPVLQSHFTGLPLELA